MRRRDRLVLAALCAAQLMLIVDVVALNVALPSIQESLDIPLGQIQLANVAYTLTFGSLLVVAGRAGDAYGRRRLFKLGLGVFTAASVLNAAAPIGAVFFAGRALQGVGAALVSPTALAMLTSTFSAGEPRNRALGVWAAVGSAGAILGQVVGGMLTDLFGWRAIFLINVPIAVVAIGAVTRRVPETVGERHHLDLRGAALLAGSVAALTGSLTRIADHGTDLAVAAGVVTSLGLVAAFWSSERHHTDPLVKPTLLAERGVRVGNGVLALLAGGTAAALFFATLYLQRSLGYSPLAVGVAFAPVTGIVLVLSPLAGRLAGRVGARALLCAGTTCVTAGLLLLSRITADGAYLTDVLPGLAMVAIGNGLSYAPTMIVATSQVPSNDQGLASGLIGTSQELGTAVGLALVAPVAAALAGSSIGADAPIDGYRIGALIAAALVGASIILAARTPRALGRTEPNGAPDRATSETGSATGPAPERRASAPTAGNAL